MKLLVTGATSGIGRATCKRFLAQGSEVFGVGRNLEKFPCDHEHYRGTNLDLADLAKLPSELKKLVEIVGTPDGVVCCAGAGRFGELEQFSYAQISRLIDLNFTSHAYLVRAFLPLMKRAGRGRLLFVGSEAALQGAQKGAVYCASKFALRGFAQSLRAECARSGIAVSIVNPGMVRSDFYADLDFAPGPDPENHLEPEDVADVIVGILKARHEAVAEEVNITPLKRSIDFGSGKD
jgi:3-hydroxy acid dehydrogenase/malonic semialdehyde reductase